MKDNGYDSIDSLGIPDIRGRIKASRRTTDRLEFVATFLRLCEKAIQSPANQTRYGAFAEVAYALADRRCDAEIWDWLQETARSADLDRQIDMRIAIFELVPDPPIIWSDLFRLWDMWFDPGARWAVYSAYVPFPRRARQHLRRYVAHRRRLQLPPPEFSDNEFGVVLKAHGGQHPPAN